MKITVLLALFTLSLPPCLAQDISGGPPTPVTPLAKKEETKEPKGTSPKYTFAEAKKILLGTKSYRDYDILKSYQDAIISLSVHGEKEKAFNALKAFFLDQERIHAYLSAPGWRPRAPFKLCALYFKNAPELFSELLKADMYKTSAGDRDRAVYLIYLDLIYGIYYLDKANDDLINFVLPFCEYVNEDRWGYLGIKVIMKFGRKEHLEKCFNFSIRWPDSCFNGTARNELPRIIAQRRHSPPACRFLVNCYKKSKYLKSTKILLLMKGGFAEQQGSAAPAQIPSYSDVSPSDAARMITIIDELKASRDVLETLPPYTLEHPQDQWERGDWKWTEEDFKRLNEIRALMLKKHEEFMASQQNLQELEKEQENR